jgi:hypothetical protein
MSKQKYSCPDCGFGLFPLYKQVKTDDGKRTFKKSGLYHCQNCDCYINGDLV